jgi:hypothetical protein
VTEPRERSERPLPRELAEGDDDAEPLEPRQLALEVRQAGVSFIWRGPVAGRRATIHGRDVRHSKP